MLAKYPLSSLSTRYPLPLCARAGECTWKRYQSSIGKTPSTSAPQLERVEGSGLGEHPLSDIRSVYIYEFQYFSWSGVFTIL
jgi:hypothetical protein